MHGRRTPWKALQRRPERETPGDHQACQASLLRLVADALVSKLQAEIIGMLAFDVVVVAVVAT